MTVTSDFRNDGIEMPCSVLLPKANIMGRMVLAHFSKVIIACVMLCSRLLFFKTYLEPGTLSKIVYPGIHVWTVFSER
jgi:hypothetical protein